MNLHFSRRLRLILGVGSPLDEAYVSFRCQSGRKALNVLDIRWASLTSRFSEPGMNKRETHLHISLADCLLSNCARFQWNGHFDPLDPRDVVDGHDGCRLVASCSSRFRCLTHDKSILDSFQCVLGSLPHWILKWEKSTTGYSFTLRTW